jgi:FkbM family methyltransferase
MFSTSYKIKIARFLSTTVLLVRRLFGLPVEVLVKRRNITWSLNLKEGIDLSIYLLGGFEISALRLYASLIKPGDVVFDVGANIGAHTLPLAQLVGNAGKVYSFEPTLFAFKKQMFNISLNPNLISRIHANHMMLMASDFEKLPESVYSSWPLENAVDLHKNHHGRMMKTNGASSSTLDAYVRNQKIKHIDFIKLDVDGNENDVLLGSKLVLNKMKPKIILELAPYVYSSEPYNFDKLIEDLWAIGYSLYSVNTGKILPKNIREIRQMIPNFGGINVLARV